MNTLRRVGSTAIVFPFILALLLALFITQTGRSDDPKPQKLLVPVEMNEKDLTAEQRSELDQIKAQEPKNWALFKLAENMPPNGKRPLVIASGPMEVNIEMKNYRVKTMDDFVILNWDGKDRSETATLVFGDKSVSGNIQYGKRLYSVAPLGDGLHALVLHKQ